MPNKTIAAPGIGRTMEPVISRWCGHVDEQRAFIHLWQQLSAQERQKN
jgi:hypothetical protein